MTLEELIAEFRLRTEDTLAPYLWSDEEVASYANDAVFEACERAKLIEDSTTSAVCTIPLVASQANYTLHPSVLAIKRISCNGDVLTETSVELLDSQDAYWETRTRKQPSEFIYRQPTSLQVVPIPIEVSNLKLTVYRLPLVSLTTDNTDASPEIHTRLHMRLVDWMLHRAYNKQDAETFNKDRAARSEADFTLSFGVRTTANIQRKRADRAPPVVRFAG